MTYEFFLTTFDRAETAGEASFALQEWVRRTSDVLAADGGLEQTLIRSARTAPEPIGAEVATLVARLQITGFYEPAIAAALKEAMAVAAQARERWGACD